MEFDFDKEIDVLLRQAAKGKAVPDTKHAAAAHLDADEIAAYAENALPEKAKQRSTVHFADCAACRRKLSNLILLNEAESELIEPLKANGFAASSAPRPRRFFAFPWLAYALGALLLAFSGVAGFIILQNVNDTSGSEISQTAGKASNANRALIDLEAGRSSEVNASNSANASAEAPPANTGAMNLSSNAAPSVAVVSSKKNAEETKSNSASDQPNTVSAVPAPIANAAVRQKNSPARAAEEQMIAKNAGSESSSGSSKETTADSDGKSGEDQETVQSEPQLSARQSEGTLMNMRSASPTAAQPKSSARNIGGKTFRRANAVWYDTAYDNQATINVRRGTDQYKDLDKNVRGFAEALQGTVIVVWKGKAYRIQ